MWWLFALILTTWDLWATIRVGRRYALGSTVLLSLLVPSWLQLPIGGLPIDLRITSSAIALIVFCLHPRTRWRGPLVGTDLLLAGLVVLHVVSDSINDGFQWLLLLRAYGEWVLLYVAGRFAIQETSDLKRLLPIACSISALLGLWSVGEAVSHINPVDLIVGQHRDAPELADAVRFGLKRALGPVQHPIFFGLLQVLLFPWTLEAAARPGP